nr:hypothetical protein [Limnochorda pilosa]
MAESVTARQPSHRAEYGLALRLRERRAAGDLLPQERTLIVQPGRSFVRVQVEVHLSQPKGHRLDRIRVAQHGLHHRQTVHPFEDKAQSSIELDPAADGRYGEPDGVSRGRLPLLGLYRPRRGARTVELEDTALAPRVDVRCSAGRDGVSWFP